MVHQQDSRFCIVGIRQPSSQKYVIQSGESTESTAGADASVGALKLYHMKLTLAYSSLLALLAIVACQSAS